MPYDMQTQISKGEAAERQLDSHFADRFLIAFATREQQRQGIDRIFTQRASGKEYAIEYKTDWTAGRTGNAFIETISVDTDTLEIPGWAYTSEAQWLVYFVPDKSCVYISRVRTLRQFLEQWVVEHGPAKAIPNDGYYTWGVPVPLSVFAGACQKIEQLHHLPD